MAEKKRRVLPKEERRDEILKAAAAVFSEKGYRTSGVSDIVERAGVARGTFYHHFDSKKEIFLELLKAYFAGFAAVLEENHRRLTAALETGGDLPGAWRENALSILRYHDENRELTTLAYREAMGLDERFSDKVRELSTFARSMMAQEFQMVADRGLLVPCDVELVTTIVNGAMINIIMDYVLTEKGLTLEELADALVTNQLRALSAPSLTSARPPAGNAPAAPKERKRRSGA